MRLSLALSTTTATRFARLFLYQMAESTSMTNPPAKANAPGQVTKALEQNVDRVSAQLELAY